MSISPFVLLCCDANVALKTFVKVENNLSLANVENMLMTFSVKEIWLH